MRNTIAVAASLLAGTAISVSSINHSAPDATLEQRVQKLETQVQRVVERLDGLEKAPTPPAAPAGEIADKKGPPVLTVRVANKRLSKSNYQEFVWMDQTYNFTGLPKVAKAVKGRIEFTDLFDEVKMALNSTINGPIKPGQVVTREGMGFKYNQFLDSHNWLLGVKDGEFKARFVVQQVLFEDGSVKKY